MRAGVKVKVSPNLMYPVEQLSREDFEAIQWRKFKYQLEYLYNNNTYYRNLFQREKLHPDQIKTKGDVRRIPLQTKQDLLEDQQANPPYGNRLGVSKEKIVQTWLTSGTSGLGQEVYGLTRLDVEHSGQEWAYCFKRYGLRQGDVIHESWPVGTAAGPLSVLWGINKVGANGFCLAPYDTKMRIQYMLRFKPDALMFTPAYLTHVTVELQKMDLDPAKEFPNLKFIMVAQESFPPSWARSMSEIWNTVIHEGYGSTQHGSCCATSCESGVVREDGSRGILHLHENTSYLEIIDRETLEPVKPGEEGELVVTNLNREASNLLRFRLADRVTFVPHDECSCGRPFHGLLAGAIARYDDMIKIRGQNVWPDAVDNVVFSYQEISEYRGKVFVDDSGNTVVEVSVQVLPGVTDVDKLVGSIAQTLKERAGVSMKVITVPPGTFTAFEFKARRWVDERHAGLAKTANR